MGYTTYPCVEVGQHFYWKIGGFQVHGLVLITSWVVIAILLDSATLAVRNPHGRSTLSAVQGLKRRSLDRNVFEYVLEFIRDVSKTQIGEKFGPWVPFIGLFTSGFQALIFASLAAAYIGESMEGHH